MTQLNKPESQRQKYSGTEQQQDHERDSFPADIEPKSNDVPIAKIGKCLNKLHEASFLRRSVGGGR